MEEYNDQEMFDLKPTFAEIYSSSSSQPLISSKEPQTSDDIDDVKQQLMNQNMSSSNIIWESSQDIIITTKPSSSNSSSSAQNINISNFENSYFQPNSDILINNCTNNTTPMAAAANGTASSQIIDFSFSAKHIDDSMANNGIFISQKRGFTATRTPSQAHEHLLAERKHREHLRQLFISLSKVVPGLKRLDKASLLEDAANYMKSLQERVTVLEQEDMKESTPINMNTSEILYDCSSSYIDQRSINNDDGKSSTDDDENRSELLLAAVPEIKAQISEKHVLISICCKKEMGVIMSRIPWEMEKLHLSVSDMRVMPFGGAALDITILAQTQSEFQGTVKDIVDHLQRVLLLNP